MASYNNNPTPEQLLEFVHLKTVNFAMAAGAGYTKRLDVKLSSRMYLVVYNGELMLETADEKKAVETYNNINS